MSRKNQNSAETVQHYINTNADRLRNAFNGFNCNECLNFIEGVLTEQLKTSATMDSEIHQDYDALSESISESVYSLREMLDILSGWSTTHELLNEPIFINGTGKEGRASK